MHISHSPLSTTSTTSSSKPAAPLSPSHLKKRKRLLDDFSASALTLTTPNIQDPATLSHQSRPPLKPLAWKRVRLSKPTVCLPPAPTGPRSKSVTASDALRSCHTCHRRPTTSLQLSSCADCEVCGERACYVCLRECEGGGCRGVVSGEGNDEMATRQRDDGRGRRICSRCCVESGVEGWVRCWVCFAGAEPAALDGEGRGGG